MNITIELGGPLAEAINNLAAALVSAKQADVVIEKASEKAARRPRRADSAEAPTPAPEAAEAPTAVAPPPAVPAGPTREDARKAILLVAKEKGHAAAAAVLKAFGASKISEVKDEDIPAVIKTAEAA